MLQNAQVSSDDNIFQDCSVWNVNGLTVVDNDDDSTLQGDISAKVNVTSDGQVVQLQDLWHVWDPLLEVVDLLEIRTQLDQWVGETVSCWVQLQCTVFEEEQVRLDQQQVGTGLDWQESGSWDNNTVSTAKVPDSGTNSSFKLQDVDVRGALRDGLLVGDDLRLDSIRLDQSLHGTQINPQVICVEVLELLDTLKFLNVLLRHLSDLQQSHLTVVVDQSTTLDIGSGLVGQFHDVFGTGLDHVVQDLSVDGGTQVVTVGDEQDLSALGQKRVQFTGGDQTLKQVTVSWRVPTVQVVVKRVWHWQQGVLEDSGETGLVEGSDSDSVALVLLDDLSSVGVSVEGVHQKKRHVGVVLSVQVLNLSHRQVQEGVAVSDLNDRLWTHTAHGSSQTTVQLQNGQLGQAVGDLLWRFLQRIVLDHLARRWRLDLVPVQGGTRSLIRQVSSEQGKEGVHFGLESLLVFFFRNSVSQVVQGITHLRRSHSGSGVVKGLLLARIEGSSSLFTYICRLSLGVFLHCERAGGGMRDPGGYINGEVYAHRSSWPALLFLEPYMPVRLLFGGVPNSG